MSENTHSTPTVRNIALGYIRDLSHPQSTESDNADLQRAHIQAEADKHHYQVEWYEDGTQPQAGGEGGNRPEWQRLEKRLADPDVAALIVFSIAKTHRKLSLFTELWERLDSLGVRFIQATPEQNVDFTAIGSGLAHRIQELFASYYAMDMLASNDANIDTEGESGVI